MDLSGFTEQGFKRKLAVQALFGKILYLSEVSLILHFITDFVIPDLLTFSLDLDPVLWNELLGL